MDQASSPISDVANFFEGRSILITGGTGFLGKVLIEKLLRSIPKIDKIYLVIRTQKNKNAQERWNSIVESSILFDHVRKLDENLLKKVVPMNGDILEDNLGLNPDDMKLICENVTIVFHCAATVRFDEPLKLAVKMNIEGTRKLLDICNKIKKLDVLVHTSTAYANCDRTSILEQVYKSDVPWRRLLDNLDWMSDEMFDQLTPYVLKGRPNTYTLTKAIAESMIVDDQESNHQLPVIMVRPSIVTGSWREPFPGWIDNWNGATGLIALGAKGLLRSICGDIERVRADLIPVDIVANALIVAAFHRGTTKGSPIFVVHCTTGQLNPTYWGQVVQTTIHNFKNKIPLVDLYRIPGGTVTPNKFEHRLRIIFDHLIPAYVIDFFSKVSGRRPFMVRTFEKLQKGLKTLEYFYTHQWNFETNAIIALNNQLSENDRKKFFIDVKQINWDTYYSDYHTGVRKYIFKEDLSNLKLARKIQFRRQLIMNFIILGFLCILSYLLLRIFSA